MALRIDASGDRLERTTNLPTPAYTIMGWVQYVSDNSQDKQPAFIKADADLSDYETAAVNYSGEMILRRNVASSDESQQLLGAMPTTGTWYWFAYAVAASINPNLYQFDMTFNAAGGSPSWISADGTTTGWQNAALGAPTVLNIGGHATWGWSNARFLGVKIWSARLSTAQMEAERYYYEPQVTSNVHAWYPLITESSDHSANGYDWTETGSISWEDYTPAGMNALDTGPVTYYVDTAAADDTGNGTTTGTAWKTISKVNASTFNAGDSILFKRGCTWYETLTVPSSGSEGSPITFGVYGAGDEPATISASRFKTGDWTGPDGNGEYTTSKSGVDNYLMLRGSTHVHYNNGLPGNLGEDEYLTSGTDLYYKPPAGHNPNEYTFEIPYRTKCIEVVSKDYVTVTGLICRGSSGVNNANPAVLVTDAAHVIISDCTVTFSTALGICVDDVSGANDDVLVTGNTVSDCIGAGIRLDLTTNSTASNNIVHAIGNQSWLVMTWLDFEGISIDALNELNNNTLVDGNTVYDIGHGGVAANCFGIQVFRSNGVTISRNHVYNCARVGIRISDGTGASAKDIAVNYNLVHDCGTTETAKGTEYGGGIVLAQDNAGGYSTGVTVYNNTVYGNGAGAASDTKQGGIVYRKGIAAASTVDIEIKNNISAFNTTYDLSITKGTGIPPAGLVLDNNLYYRSSGNMIALSPGETATGTWTAAGQTGAERANDASGGIENFRNIIEAGQISTSGSFVRVKLEGHSTTAYEVQGISIGVRSGTSEDFAAAPTKLNYNGAPISATNPLTVGAGESVYTDFTGFTLDETKDHLIHVWVPEMTVASKWDEGSGTNSYYNTAASDMTLTENFTASGSTDFISMVSALEVGSISDYYTQAQLATYQATSSQDASAVSADPAFVSASDFHLAPDSPCIDAGVDVGLTLDYDGVAVGDPPEIGAYQFAPTHRTLTASGGSFTWGVVAAALLRGFVLQAEATHPDPTLENYSLTLDPAAYTLTGEASESWVDYGIGADGDTLALTGGAAALGNVKRLVSEGTSYSLTGEDSALSTTNILAATGAAVAYTGGAAGTRVARFVAAAGDSFTWTGEDIDYFLDLKVIAGGTQYLLQGQNTEFIYSPDPVSPQERTFIWVG